MKKWHKITIFSSVLIIIVGLILINVFQTTTKNAEKANEVLEQIEAENEISEELYADSKQLFDILELAHGEQRELTSEEHQLLDEYDTKYNDESKELTHAETMVVNQLILMSYEVVPTQSEKNRYEDYKEGLLDYVDF